MNRKQEKAMWAKKGSLPSRKISLANGRPDEYLNHKEPEIIKLRQGNFDGTHFKDINGNIRTLSEKASGILRTTGFKSPVKTDFTPRGFNPPTEEFDIWTDAYGNVFKTRQGTPTWNGGDVSEAEHSGLGSSWTFKGKKFIDQGLGRQDRESRSPIRNPKKKFYNEDYNEKKERDEWEHQKNKWKNKNKICSRCGGSGNAFNFDDAVKASTGRVGRMTGMGKCRRCGGSGRA